MMGGIPGVNPTAITHIRFRYRARDGSRRIPHDRVADQGHRTAAVDGNTPAIPDRAADDIAGDDIAC